MLNKPALWLASSLAFFSASAHSLTPIQANPDNSAYAQDVRGAILRSDSGLCWRTGDWSPDDAVAGCDGPLVPPMVKPTAPELVPSTAQPILPPPLLVMQPARRCDFDWSLSSDDAFAFGKATLSAAASTRLKEYFQENITRCSTVETVTITAHTDRLGTTSANQRLSEQRARTIAAQLAGFGTDSSVIGAGSTEPLTQCSDKLDRVRLVRCLAPDRRATIVVRGQAK